MDRLTDELEGVRSIAETIESLFRAHWSLVRAYLTWRTGSASLGEELAQETFLRDGRRGNRHDDGVRSEVDRVGH